MESTFIKVGISAATAKTYVQTFSSKEISRNSSHMLDCAMLKELGIKIMGDILAILKWTKEAPVSLASYVKLPQLKLEMTPTTVPKIHKNDQSSSHTD